MHYVVMTPDHIGEVMRGERTMLPVTLPAQPGDTIGLKTAHHRKATCHMDVTLCEPDGDGHVIHLTPHVYDDAPKLLPRSLRPPMWATDDHGYTHIGAFALAGEPEAVDPWTQDQITIAAIGRDAKRRRQESIAARRDRALLTIVERITLAKTTASRNGISIHAEVKAITRMQERGRSDGLIEAELERVERLAHREAA